MEEAVAGGLGGGGHDPLDGSASDRWQRQLDVHRQLDVQHRAGVDLVQLVVAGCPGALARVRRRVVAEGDEVRLVERAEINGWNAGIASWPRARPDWR